jgi:ATP-dependent exoDNAse (exonuclease V) beta subunit
MNQALQRPADWRQREQALDPERSFIVQAPAGSGKTELLIQRMLCLLARVEHPEEVVAITFTRKAANEMRNRLVRELQAAGAGTASRDLEPHQQVSRRLALEALRNDAARDWGLLLQPNRLQIRTIDSLCGDLARQLPVLSGLGGGLRIAEHPEALYMMAASRTLAAIEAPDDPLREHLVRVLDRYDNQYDRLLELLSGMLANRDQWLGHIMAVRGQGQFKRAPLEDALRILVESQLETALQATPDFLLRDLPELLRFALENGPGDEAELRALLDRSGDATIRLGAAAEDLRHWQTVIRRLLTADGKNWRKTVTVREGFPAPSSARGETAARYRAMKDECCALLERLRDDEGLRESFNAVRMLPEPAYSDEAWASLESLLHILLRAAGEWSLVAAESGEVDFTEVSSRAIQSLGSGEAPSELALRLDYRIAHLLVDEFQDTSSSQILLLRRLTAGWAGGDGRSLFLVGDPMQSIYRFRKAEVSLFIETWEGRIFDQLEMQNLRLEVNFRSTRPLVDWVNQSFPAVMPKRNDPVMAAVCYSPSRTRPNVGADGGVELQLSCGRDDRQEAQRLVDIIARTPEQETIAVLVRSRNHAVEVLAALDRLKQDQPRFRYQAMDFFRLAETPLIQDLVSLTLALAQPADSLAWFSVLRAPFAGLDLADLEKLAAADGEGLVIDALRLCRSDADEEGLPGLSEDGRQRLARITPPLLAAAARRGRQSSRSLVEAAWLALGGPACLQHAGELDDARTYFELLESLAAEQASIDRESLELRLQSLFAKPDPDASGHLKVMTVYAAKGLEFDHVILPGLNRTPAGDPSRLVHWFELAGTDRMVLSPMRNAEDKARHRNSGDLIRFIADTESRRKRFEDGRLLYVAATRAVRKLHLLGALEPRANGELRPNRGSLLEVLWPAVSEAVRPGLLEDAEQQSPEPALQLQSGAGGISQTWRRLAPDWTLPEPPDGVATTEPGPPESRDYIEFSWAGEGARLAGVLVHRLLQQAGMLGPERWARTGIDTLAPWCRNYLAARGLPPQEAEPIVASVEQAMRRCLATETGHWILSERPDAQCELAITAMQDGRPRSLVLDRTFVEGGVRWIIDYKTSSHAGGDLEGFLRSETERYTPQLRRYRAALAGELPIRTALYYPLLDRLCEIDAA